MSEEITEVLTEDSSVTTGEYPEIAQRYKAGEQLTDEDLDTIADVAVSVLRSILTHFDAESSPIDEYDGDDGELILDVTAPDLACPDWTSRTHSRILAGSRFSSG